MRKELTLLYDDDHKPKTLMDESALGYYLAMSQRHGVVRCSPKDAGACPVKVANPVLEPGQPAFITAYFKLKDGHEVRWGRRKGRNNRRTLCLCCPLEEWQEERRTGFARKLQRGEISRERFDKAMRSMTPAGRALAVPPAEGEE
jgi:hypothetical protein